MSYPSIESAPKPYTIQHQYIAKFPAQNLYQNSYCPSNKYLSIGYLDPLGKMTHSGAQLRGFGRIRSVQHGGRGFRALTRRSEGDPNSSDRKFENSWTLLNMRKRSQMVGVFEQASRSASNEGHVLDLAVLVALTKRVQVHNNHILTKTLY